MRNKDYILTEIPADNLLLVNFSFFIFNSNLNF
jgi:GH18 family chitinase